MKFDFQVAHREDDSCPCARELLVEPGERVEHFVQGFVDDQVIGVVQADRKYDSLLTQGPPDIIDHRPDRCAGGRGLMAVDLLKDLREDGEFRPLELAVHIDRDQPPGRVFHLGEDAADCGRLPGPGQAPEDDVAWPAAVETVLQGECDILQLGLAVIEDIRDIIDLEQVTVSEERFVRIEVPFHRKRLLSGRDHIALNRVS